MVAATDAGETLIAAETARRLEPRGQALAMVPPPEPAEPDGGGVAVGRPHSGSGAPPTPSGSPCERGRVR